MNYNEMLKTTQVLRMLYGTTVAELYFEENVVKYYNNDLEALRIYKSRAKVETTNE